MKEFAGREGFYWWHGVVEDVNDPLMLGRCRVRVFGYHTEDLVELPTTDLPWAYPMQPITSAALSGIGTSPTGLLNGSHVFGFFRDDDEGQDPVIIGSFGGIPQSKPNKNKGYNDPGGVYPPSDVPVPIGISVVGECDTNRLVRNDDKIESTIVNYKKKTIVSDVSSTPDMSGTRQWNEPSTPYAAQYPKNHVRFTESGHVEEYDDTPGAERVHVFHKSGTFTEVANGWKDDPDGTRVQRIVGHDYEIVHGNKKVYIRGKEGLDLVIDGSVNITINNGGNIQINGDTNILANNDVNLQIEGSLKASGKDMQFFSQGDVAFSGKSVSFITDSGVMVIAQNGRVEINSGDPVVRPEKVNLK